MKRINLGAAKLIVELAEGIITAHHENGALLFTGIAGKGSWDRVIAGILRSCPQGIGPMTQGAGRLAKRKVKSYET